MNPLPSPDSPLDQLMTSRRIEKGRWRIDIPEGWQQGRGAFGGFVVGIMIRAIEGELADPGRALRSLTAELCGPTQPGPADLKVEILRAGSAVTTVVCRLEQDGAVQAHAVGVLGKSRMTAQDGTHLAAPAPRTWRELEVLPVEPPMGPDFARHFEFRTEGPLPFSGGAKPVAEGWIRPKRPGTARDAAYLAACVDAWWPALFTCETAPRPMATIAFTLDFTSPLTGPSANAPLFHRGRDVSIRDGYVTEVRELWSEDGRLLALNQQTFVIIK